MSEIFGKKLYEARKAVKFSLQDLASATDSSKSYIWELENRAEINISANKLLAIAKALGRPMNWFLEDVKDNRCTFYGKLNPSDAQFVQSIINRLEAR